MAATPTVYVICDKNCRFEGMTKEQIYAAIVQAVNEGTIGEIDTGFITTIKTINGTPLKFFVGEQAAYDALTDEEKKDLFAIITNDTTKDGIMTALEKLQKDYKELSEGISKGSIAVAKAKAIDNTEIFFNEVSTSGVKVEKITAGRTYIITAGGLDTNTANERETMLLSIPASKGSHGVCTAVHSTPTRGGFYCRCVLNSPPDIWFYNSGNAKVQAHSVTIREI